MKTAIIYSSISGNTKRIAEAIHSVVQDAPLIDVKDIEAYDLQQIDVLFIGYWVDKGNCDARSRQLLLNLHGKTIALFATLGAAENSAYYDMVKKNVEADIVDHHILAHFLCQGKVNDALIERYRMLLEKNPDDEHMKQQVANYENGKSHPNATDIENAKAFAINVLETWQKKSVSDISRN